MFLLQAARFTARKSLSFKNVISIKIFPGIKTIPGSLQSLLDGAHRIVGIGGK
jgi:hypothetical protein